MASSVAKMNAKAAALRASMPDDVAATPGPRSTGKPSSAGRNRRTTAEVTTDTAQLAADYEVMRHRYEEVLKENETLKGEQKRRMESYMRRETNYQADIEDLKAELERQGKARPPEDTRMKALRSEHGKVIEQLNSMRQRENLSLQEQEKDLLRAFRARLWDVQFELETERAKKDDGALEWIEKTKTLGKELDWSRDEALRLDRMNQHLTAESAKLKLQLKAGEEDRSFIMNQMLSLKRENARLKAAAAAAQSAPTEDERGGAGGPGRSQSASLRRGGDDGARPGLSRPMTAGASAFRALEEIEAAEGAGGLSHGSLASSERVKELMLQQSESEERYREYIGRLKRLLDVERRNLRAVRSAHSKDLQSRTELETLLRACVDDVRKELTIAQRQASGLQSPPPGQLEARMVGVDELGPKERERTLELLLSQERVVSLLYERSFPQGADAPAADAAAAEPESDAVASPP